MTNPIKRPMKGDQLDDLDRLIFPLYGSPKIDGFRCILDRYPLTSRLSRFPNEHFHKTLSGVLPVGRVLDSEAVVGRRSGQGVLSRTSSGLTSENGTPEFTLWVFDQCGPKHIGKDWLTRHLDVGEFIRDLGHPNIRLLRHRLIRDRLELEEYIQEKLELGFEGVMTRSVAGPYKQGKSTLKEQYLLKIKPFKDFEARIIGYFEEMENTNEAKREATGKLKRSSAKAGKVGKGRLGGFIGEVLDSRGTPTGETCRVGGGFTADQRVRYWAIKDELVAAGEIMKCKKQAVGEKDKPRHPAFISIRPKWDMS